MRTLRLASWSLRLHVRGCVVVSILLALLAVTAMLALTTGSALTVGEALASLLGYGDATADLVVQRFRAPRVLLGLLVGAALGAAGTVVQSLTRNPLGTPDLIGVNAGAAAGAVLMILVFGGAYVTPGALVCGLVAGALVYLLAFKRGVGGTRLVLVGIGVNAMLHSVIAYLLTRADLYDAQHAKLWLIGSLAGAGWDRVWPIGLAVAAGLPVLLALSRSLSLLELGDDVASGLGLRVERLRLVLLLVSVGLSGVAVSVSGPITFVALAAPQLARRLTLTPGPGVAASAATGALLLTGADLLAQRLPTAGQLPVGVLTGVLGGLYLAWLLRRAAARSGPGWRSR